MSVFDMDGTEPSLDKMGPALAAEVGMGMKSTMPRGHNTGKAQSCVPQRETVFAIWS
jgi:hypothetical protein